MPFTDEEVTVILQKLRKLRELVHATSAGRYVTTWSYRNGQWHLRDWQEGEALYDGPLTEDEIVTAFHAPFPKGHWAHAWVDAALDRRGSMDMPQLYKRLGILRDGEDIKLLDAAPWANVRRAIMGEPPTGNPKVPASIPGPP